MQPQEVQQGQPVQQVQQAQPVQQVQQAQPVQQAQQVQQVQQMNSEKEWIVTLLLAILLPGIDRMYAGSIGLGILKFITFGGLGLWWLVDIVMLVTGSYKDGNGNPIASK